MQRAHVLDDLLTVLAERENVRALRDEALSCSETDPAVASSDDGYFSFQLVSVVVFTPTATVLLRRAGQSRTMRSTSPPRVEPIRGCGS
jgi:hypothetical protein